MDFGRFWTRTQNIINLYTDFEEKGVFFFNIHQLLLELSRRPKLQAENKTNSDYTSNFGSVNTVPEVLIYMSLNHITSYNNIQPKDIHPSGEESLPCKIWVTLKCTCKQNNPYSYHNSDFFPSFPTMKHINRKLLFCQRLGTKDCIGPQ